MLSINYNSLFIYFISMGIFYINFTLFRQLETLNLILDQEVDYTSINIYLQTWMRVVLSSIVN